MTALSLPGTAGNYASAPDSAALSPTGDIDIRFRGAFADWTPAALRYVVAKYGFNTSNRAYRFGVDTTGKPFLVLSNNGSTNATATSSAATGFTDGTLNWIRVTYRVSDRRTQFFTAPGTVADPATSDWTQLGTNQTHATTSIFDSSSVLQMGADGEAGNNLQADFYRVQIRNNVLDDGTGIVFDAKFTDVVIVGTRNPTTLTESSTNAATVTANGSGWDWIVTSTTVSGSQATETDTANTGTAAVTVAGSQVTVTHTANAGTAAVTVSGTQVSETDTANGATAAVVVAGSRANETDTANAGSIAGVAPVAATITATITTPNAISATDAPVGYLVTSATTGTVTVTTGEG